MVQLVGGLFGATVLAWVLVGAGVDLMALAWAPGVSPLDPRSVAHWLIEPVGNAFGVVLALLVLALALPTLAHSFTRQQLLTWLGWAVGAGTLLPMAIGLLDAGGLVDLAPVPLLGWTGLLAGLICLFGLANPGAEIRLYFVLPIPALWLVWGSLMVTVLQLAAAFGGTGAVYGPLEQLGIWLGTWGWYHGVGPGSRRRRLQQKGRSIERELKRFTVLPGGKDDTVH